MDGERKTVRLHAVDCRGVGGCLCILYVCIDPASGAAVRLIDP